MEYRKTRQYKRKRNKHSQGVYPGRTYKAGFTVKFSQVIDGITFAREVTIKKRLSHIELQRTLTSAFGNDIKIKKVING